MRKLIAICLTALAFGAMSTAQESNQVPPQQQLTASPASGAGSTASTSVADGNAVVYVYRYKQYVGSALEPSVYANDTQLARMDNGRYFRASLPAGKHLLRSNDKQSGVELNLESGKEYYVRIELATGMWKGHGRLLLVQPEQGAYEIKKLKYLGGDKIVAKEMVAAAPVDGAPTGK
jgi:hypothetical protein